MPPLPGEERVLTLFADIHYYFTAPTPRPLHHRFDKGSYFYIYYNATRRTSRLEVANNPGTRAQDDFHGYLDRIQARWSYKFPTLLTIVVDAVETSPGGHSSPDQSHNEWRLASADPRDQGSYMYRLHTLDIYFWTQNDARLVVDATKKLMSPAQMEYLEEEHPEAHHAEMSPVVQQLESIAISDPAYANGQTRNSQNQPTNLQPQLGPPLAQSMTSPARAPAHDAVTEPASSLHSTKSTESPAAFAPLAYNPAAPPAPEPIAHREKTPPPLDAADGTGLAAAAVMDHHQSLSSPYAQPYTGIPGPPSAQPPAPWGQPPSAAHQQYTSPPPQTFQHTPSVSSTSSYRASVTPSFAPPPADPNAHLYGAVSTPEVQSPGVQLYGSAQVPQNHPPLQHLQPQYADYLASRPQAPPGGYAQYSYDLQHQQQQQAASTTNNPYDVHAQLYRPTESEAHSHTKPSSGGQKPGKLEERTEKMEKSVNRFLKKLEKRL